MIKIYRGPVLKNSECAWRTANTTLSGFSNQPLLDACRELKRMGVDCRREVALFREGAANWDLKTTVGYGASKRVSEEDRGGLRLRDYTEAPQWRGELATPAHNSE